MNSVSNRQLTLLRKLNQKKYRYKKRLFLIEGVRAVLQVAANRADMIETLFFDESRQLASQPQWKQLAAGRDAVLMNKSDFAEISDTNNPQGVLALCRMPDEQSPEVIDRCSGIIVALDAVQDPGNAGTIVRTACWFGAAGLLWGKGTVDLFHPKVVRSTAGATGALPYYQGELSVVLSDFEEKGWKTILLHKSDRSVDLSATTPAEKTIIVVGNEANGIDPLLHESNRLQAEIISPGSQRASVESLNAAIAASIALYHLSK